MTIEGQTAEKLVAKESQVYEIGDSSETVYVIIS